MTIPDTYFLPAERADEQSVANDCRRLSEAPLLVSLLNSFPEAAMVLNEQRQIVYANDKLLRYLNKTLDQALGLRPGEVLDCVNAQKQAGGCGSSEFCVNCGAANSIANCAASNEAQVEECRITCSSEAEVSALDFRVWATPLACDGRFTVLALRDTTDEKRRAVLEKLFFHDTLNAAGALKGLIDLWPDLSLAEKTKLTGLAGNIADELIEGIRSHRDLGAAERGDLRTTLKRFDIRPLLKRSCLVYGNHPLAAGKFVTPPEVTGPAIVYSDELLLSRVIGNLLKNAIEASPVGSTIGLSFNGLTQPTIAVHNEGCMTKEVQLQVFQRSFSTKASKGRGIGSYSVQLLTTRYLKGNVHFTSSEEAGTTFIVTLPSEPE